MKRIDRRSDGRFDIDLRFPIDDKQRFDMPASVFVIRPLPQNDPPKEPKQDTDSARREESYPRAPVLVPTVRISAGITKLYTIAYLILFAMLGTLARLGLQAITFFPGAPVVFSELWPNAAGTLIMGFLVEDRMLFKEEWGVAVYDDKIQEAKKFSQDDSVDLASAKKAHGATKKTIPLFVGLATGFCGSFTTFSAFIRDTFLALSNNLPTPLGHPTDIALNGTSLTSTTTTVSRNAGFSIISVLEVLIITLSICITAFRFGIDLAQLLEPYTPSLSFVFTRQFLDRFAVILALGGWTIAIILTILPPSPSWRGKVLFALVFAPIGCLGRFYASLYLNPRFSSFPLGTFFVNILGTAMLGVAFNFQHSGIGSALGCQVLQGVMDGLCGSLTTLSTWVAELTTLKKSLAFLYGSLSVALALGLLVAVMGSFRWTVGFSEPTCVH